MMRCKLCKNATAKANKNRHCWNYMHCPKCHYLGKTGAGRKHEV